MAISTDKHKNKQEDNNLKYLENKNEEKKTTVWIFFKNLRN